MLFVHEFDISSLYFRHMSSSFTNNFENGIINWMYQNEYTYICIYIFQENYSMTDLYGITEMDINSSKVIKISVFPKANRNSPPLFFLLIRFKQI